MKWRRTLALIGVMVTFALVSATPALAKQHQATIANYYYQDEETKSRKQIVVTKGDQIVFTNVEGVFPPHTVEVDELDIHSGGILQGQTYTTPPLKKTGNFLLYCMPHRDRGHVARLIIEPAPVKATTPKTNTGARASAQPLRAAGATASPGVSAEILQVTTPLPLAPLPVPSTADIPSGIGTADLRVLEHAQVDPDSLEGLLGRKIGGRSWTRALWWLAFASVPIVGAGAFALRRDAQLRSAAEAEALARAEAATAKRRKRKPAQRKKR